VNDDIRAWVGRAPQSVVWVAKHGDQVTAVFQWLSEAVLEAESFLTKTGPEKKDYARELVLARLEEIGIPVGEDLFSSILRAIIDNLINATVSLFNKFPETNPAFKFEKPLEEYTVAELREIAEREGAEIKSDDTKADIIAAIEAWRR
jgi:hypothetical protein